MAKHLMTTDELKARIYTLRQAKAFLKPEAKQWRVERRIYDKVAMELADIRHAYYARPDRNGSFIKEDAGLS
jgi:hypothetical protein